MRDVRKIRNRNYLGVTASPGRWSERGEATVISLSLHLLRLRSDKTTDAKPVVLRIAAGRVEARRVEIQIVRVAVAVG